MGLNEENRQMSMIIPNLEELVDEEHPYRKMLKLVDFEVYLRVCVNSIPNVVEKDILYQPVLSV